MPKDNSFESKILELEELVRKLEEGEVSLDESKNIYKKGISIAKQCNDLLKETELEISELKAELDNQFDNAEE
ncbi:MAG: exodeoxyribonuclease VII small subunit [Chloroflexi bacterium]|nr:exodeoxyribonuclease VII small subunit [Chloroflexota bacterium]|tara:strand:- start:14363 stop:14581 length:219 start_codon:yes stop_codon:yes gene_type:complete